MNIDESEAIINSLKQTLELTYSKEETYNIITYLRNIIVVFAAVGAPIDDPLFTEALRSVAIILDTARGIRET